MTDFSLTAAGGNSRAARSARAKLQWRDRYGRWIEMGRGIKFKVRLPNGATPSVNGQFVGAKTSDIGQVYVKNDPNGVPDGFYDVTSANAQEFIASLSPEQLSERGIELGKDISGNPVGSRIDSDVPNLAEMTMSEAPEGWTVTKRDANGNATSFSTDDGDFGYDLATWGYPMMWKKDSTTYAKVNDWAEGLDLVNKIDEGSASWDDVAQRPKKPTKAELEAKLDRLNEQYGKTTNAAALRRLDRQIEEAEAALEAGDFAEEGADTADVPSSPDAAPQGAIDTDTHGVAKEGFIVPTGKSTSDSSPEGIATLVESEKDYLTEGSGKRLVLDTETGTAEIYTSADTLDNAKAQAGGMAAKQVIDLSSGEEVPVAEGKDVVDPNSPEVNPNLDGDTTPREERSNDQGSGTDSEQPVGDDTGADSPVGDSNQPAAEPDTDNGGSGDGGAVPDSGTEDGPDRPDNSPERVEPPRELTLEEKQAKLDKLYERHAKAKNPDVLDTLDREISSLETEIERDRARQDVADAQGELDAARESVDNAGEDADAGQMSRVDIAQQDVEGLQARLDSLEQNMDKSIDELKAMLDPEFNAQADGLIDVDLGAGFSAEPITDDTRKDLVELAESAFPDSAYGMYIRDAKSGYVAKDSEGNFMGVLVTSKTSDTLNVDKLYIVPDAQESGARLGTRLMKTAASDAREQGLSLEIPESITEAKAFYKKLGAITPGIDDDSVDIPGTEQIFTDEARDRLAEVDIDNPEALAQLPAKTTTKLERYLDTLSPEDRADYDRWSSAVDVSADIDDDIINNFEVAKDRAQAYSAQAEAEGIENSDEFGKWLVFDDRQFDSFQAAYAAFAADNAPATVEEAPPWAADKNNPTAEEIKNAPEGALLKRVHMESQDETFFKKEGPLWRQVSRNGTPGKFTTNGDTFSGGGSNVSVVIDELPDAPKAPETPAESGLTDEQLDAMIDSIFENEGGSFNLVDGTSPEDGYMVAIRGFNREIPADEFRNKERGREFIRQYIKDNEEQLAGDGKHLGVWYDTNNDEIAFDVSERIESREDAIAAGIERNQQSIWDVVAGEEIPTGGTGDRAEAVTLDPSGDLRAQIQDAIDSGARIRFQYTSAGSGTKVRELTPERVWFNPKQGHNLVEGKDAETGEDRKFILEKIEPVGSTLKNPVDMSSEELDAELASYDFETADSETRSRIFDLEMERGWRADASVFSPEDVRPESSAGPAFIRDENGNATGRADGLIGMNANTQDRVTVFDGETGEPLGEISSSSLVSRKMLKEREFPGLSERSPVNTSEMGEPRDSAALFEIETNEPSPEERATDVLPQSAGLVDDFEVPEGITSERMSSLPDGVTPTKAPSELVDNITRSQEAARRLEFGYQDKDEDYANEKFMPTQEQRDVIMAVLGGNNVAVQALAGTGKTSTLELLARRIQEEYPDKKILYIAFNKSVQEEAEARMPANVETRTGDSLGWVGISREITKKKDNADALTLPRDIAAEFDIRNTSFDGETEIEADDIVRDLLQVINRFTISEDAEINRSHFADLDIPFNERTKFWADEFWADITSKNGKLKFTNSHATKIWALSGPDLSKNGSGVRKPADIIFFDEAQDINPVMAKVVRDQGIQKVYVGDGRQAIYGFRGAENELDNVQVDFTLPLTQSWRFGPEVAGYGNRYLSLINSPLKIVGGGPAGEIVEPGSMTDPDAVLTRSNAGAVKAILEQIGLGRTVGASSKFKTDLQSLIQSVRWLKFQNGRRPRIHDDLQGYKSWDEIDRDVARGKAGAKVEMLFNLVEKMGIDTLQTAVDALRNADKKETKDKKEFDSVRYEQGASGSLGEVQGRFGPVKISYAVTAGKDKELRLAVTNAFPIKDRLKEVGFRFNGDDKTWYLEGSAQELEAAFGSFVQNDAAPIDVVVSTAHKAKGLEWGRVKIGDDFRGPSVSYDDNGEEFIEWPSPEELRLAYVAVTRAQQALDPGSLAWVELYTNEDDERPDVPSRGLPGEPGYDEAPAPEPEPEPEPVQEITPEPEITPAPVQEVAPESQPIQEVIPEPEEPLEAPVQPEEGVQPEEVGDGLPDSITELEDIAGRMEREIATARPARARVLQREVDRIYDKIDRLSEQGPEPEAPQEVAPEAPEVVEEVLPDLDEIAPIEPISRALIEGKDLDVDQAEIIEDLIDRGDIEAVQTILSEAPNKPNTETKPKSVPEHRAPVNEERARAPRSVSHVEEPNEILRDLKADFPDHEVRENNDTVVARMSVGTRDYAIVVRRTNREQFFAFLEETDRNTGMRRVVRLRKNGVRNHSYRALMTQINTGLDMFKKNPKKSIDRKRKGVEVLNPGEDLITEAMDGVLDGTDLPESKDALYNNVVRAIAGLAEDPELSIEVLRTLATDNGFNPDLADAVLASVGRRKYAEGIQRQGFGAPSHISYNAQVVEEGMLVDWTDTDRTVPIKDEFGNVLRGPDGKALNKPNPNYGRVFRGRVTKVLPRKESHSGAYTYSDPVLVNFPEYDEVMGTRSLQRDRTTAGLTVVTDENSPLTAPFFPPKRQEQAARLRASDFGAPENGGDTVARQIMPAAWKDASVQVDETGIWEVPFEGSRVRLPVNNVEYAEALQGAIPTIRAARGINPGQFIALDREGLNIPALVVNKEFIYEPGGGVRLTLVRPAENGGYLQKTLNVPEIDGQRFLVFDGVGDRLEVGEFAPAPSVTEIQARLRMLMASKAVPARLKPSLEKALSAEDATMETLADVADSLRALKNKKPAKNDSNALADVLEMIRDNALKDPNVGGRPDVIDLGAAIRMIRQDSANMDAVPDDVPTERPARVLNDFVDIEIPDQDFLDREDRARELLRKSFEGGFTPDVFRRIVNGAINNGVALGTTDDGRKVFTKLISDEYEYENEILAMRVANILGLNRIHTTGLGSVREPKGIEARGDVYDDYFQIVMDEAPGVLGAETNYQAAVNKMETVPEIALMGLFDHIVNLSDRNTGNFFITEEGNAVVPIDNSYAFSSVGYSMFAEEFMRLLGRGRVPLTPAQVLRFRGQIFGLQDEFAELGRHQDWVDMMVRITNVLNRMNGYND